ncbi:MAG: hypothetical protein HKN17_02845, partial [Rhodothermales bacterium]|nr:hypothetical protein [Rhodothermales bacterium]
MRTATIRLYAIQRVSAAFPLLIGSLIAVLIAVGTAGAAPSDRGHDDIVDVASSAGMFEKLLAAVDAAGLTHTLRGDGPFTVFAPTDDAFARLAAGTVDALLRPENRDRLVELLTFH